MPTLFSPTIGAAIAARHWFECAARAAAPRRRSLDHHRDAAVTTLIPFLSCRSCRVAMVWRELNRPS
jgi:hypothetical protein